LKKLIAPSLLSADFANLEREIEAIEEAGADWLHIDVMDGHFVPNITFGPQVVAAIRRVTKLPLDVHLMIEHPENFYRNFIDAGSDALTVHVETSDDLESLLDKIKEQGKGVHAGVSLNPPTPLAQIERLLPQIDILLVMSVNPGFGGQSFIVSSLEKIAAAKALRECGDADFLIAVDGGVNIENIGKVASVGADVLVAGAAIFKTPDYAATIAAMRSQIALVSS